MKNIHILLCSALVLTSLSTSAQVITVQRNGQSFFHYDVNQFEALIETTSPSHTLPGDTVILPGGIITTAALVVNKPLTFIGAGMLESGAPVTFRTTLDGGTGLGADLIIDGAAAGVSFHGIAFDRPIAFSGQVNVPTFNAAFYRCRFMTSFGLGGLFNAPPSNVTIVQSILDGAIGSTNGTPANLTVSNCFITGVIGLHVGSNVLFDQNIIFVPSLNNPSYTYTGVSFTNNMFLRSGVSVIGFSSVNGATFYNNLFATNGANNPAFTFGPNVGANVGNQSAPSINVLFANVPTFTGFNEQYDYHLLPGSPGVGMGLFGYDVGVHDGPPGAAWKEDGIPFNPHWEELSPLGTTNGGVVNVSIKAAAQQN